MIPRVMIPRVMIPRAMKGNEKMVTIEEEGFELHSYIIIIFG
jgi:hypothetical protein